MNRFILLLVLLISSLVEVFAGDPIEEILKKTKDAKYEKPYQDLQLIADHIKSIQTLSDNDLTKIKEIIDCFYKEKDHNSYFYPVLEITRSLKKDQLYIVKPLMLKILSDPKEPGCDSLLGELDFIFDDFSGEMLIKYKHLAKDQESLVNYLLMSKKFNQIRYKAFRETFISLLDDKEMKYKNQFYYRLKSEISFIDCLGEDKYKESSESEKEIEVKKMRDWLANTPDLDLAFEKFYIDLQNKIGSLTIENFTTETEILKRNYQFLARMPGGQALLLKPFDEKDKEFSLGLKIVIDEMQAYFKLHNGSFSHYSTFQLDLLVRTIGDKLFEKTRAYYGAINLEPYKKNILEIKMAIANKDKNLISLAENLYHKLEVRIAYTRSESHKESFRGLLKELLELVPSVLDSRKNATGVLEVYDFYLEVGFVDGKIKINENGLNIKILIENKGKSEITIGNEFSLALNIGLIFDDINTRDRFQLGNTISEFKFDTEVMLNAITLKPNEKLELKISDLIEKTKDFKLPKGKYKVKAEYISYKGKNCVFASFTSSEKIVEKE